MDGWMDVTQSKSRRNNKRDDLYNKSGNILINWIIISVQNKMNSFPNYASL